MPAARSDHQTRDGREGHGHAAAADGGSDDHAEGCDDDDDADGVDHGVVGDRGRHRAAASEGAAGRDEAEVAEAGGGRTDEEDGVVPLLLLHRRRGLGNGAAVGAAPLPTGVGRALRVRPRPLRHRS